MTKNTKKPWQGRFSEETDKFVESFTSSIDFDKRLYSYDIQGTVAHSMMLKSIGILSDSELKEILSALVKVEKKIGELLPEEIRGDWEYLRSIEGLMDENTLMIFPYKIDIE